MFHKYKWRPSGGFTFVEVMISLAIIAMTLVAIIGAQSRSMQLIDQSRELTFLE